MKCYACNNYSPINRWRVINLDTSNRRDTRLSQVIYFNKPGVNQFDVLYACPKCGTVRIKTPLDR